MRTVRRVEPDRASPRLWRRRFDEREELWTEAVGRLPPVYGETWVERDGRRLRRFEPARSKLAAAIAADWTGPLPRPGERWLYLGAASGTTASHVADLVGPSGSVYALERSVRPFARLLATSERYPNLLPILGDARVPETYADLVPVVAGLYADVAQPDQAEIVRKNAELLLAGAGAAVLVALKTPSMGREHGPARHRATAESALSGFLDLERAVRLDPFHRGHYMVGGVVRDDRPGVRGPVTPPSGTTRGRRRS